jgi:AAA+ ATPase superfamily predicted ATPase
MLQKYYDGTKLLSMKDINGKKPELFITTGNRSSGKTTYYGRYFMNRFFKNKEKFGLIYRYNYELDDCADKFYKDLSNLFFPGTTMKSERKAGGIFHELFVDEVSCGYALSLNSSDQIKKYSHLLSDITKLLFDEFQSETNHYCSDEIRKFISLHTSIARGNGEVYVK